MNGGTFESSDMRLKSGVRMVGSAHNGLPLYHFSYIGDPTVYEGVMAQDVMLHTPQAVVTRDNGYMAVDYGMLGLSMQVVD